MLAAFSDVLIRRSCAEAIAAAAIRDFPRETCGLLIGDVHGGAARVLAIAPTNNVSASPRGFAICSREHAAVVAGLAVGQTILGVFHSHHDRPEPSVPDIENMRLHRLLSIIAGHSAKGSPDDVRLVAFQAGKTGRIHRFDIGFASVAEPR